MSISKAHLATVYEYLELRFSSPLLRRIASASFAITSLVHLASLLALLLPSLETATSIPTPALLGALLGLAALASTSGLAPLAWLSLWQLTTCLASLAALVALTWPEQGLSTLLPKLSLASWSTDPRSPSSPVLFLGHLLLHGSLTARQTEAQRLLATSKIRSARLSIISCLAFAWIFVPLAVLASLVLAELSSSSSDSLHFSSPLLSGPGLKGLLATGLLSSLIPCISSSLLSLSTLIFEEFINTWSCAPTSSTVSLAIVRILSCVLAVLVGLVAYFFAFLPSLPPPSAALSVASPPLLAIFILGLFAPKVSHVVSAFDFRH